MFKQSTFTINQSQLLEILKRLKKLSSSVKKDSVLEITVIDDYTILNMPGVEFKLSVITMGSAKFTVGVNYFLNLVTSFVEDSLTFTISENQVQIKSSKFTTQTTFFEDDSILRSIQLPINYDFFDLIKLKLSNNYTPEEIKFNKLDLQVEDAMEQLKADINQIAHIANKYHISLSEVGDFIVDKIK